MRFSWLSVALLSVCTTAAHTALAQSYTNLVNVVKNGQAAPGGGTISAPANTVPSLTISSTGAVAFRATTTGGPTSAVYVGDGVSLKRILAVGDSVGGNSILGLGAIVDNPYINAGGDVVIRATLPSTGSGVFRYTNATDSISTVATNTTVVPVSGNSNNTSYGALGRASINDSGTIAFSSVNGVFTQNSAGVVDAPIPFGALGSTFITGVGNVTAASNVRINNAGAIALNATADGIAKIVDYAPFGLSSTIAEAGGEAPGGGTFGSLNSPYMSPSSRFATFTSSINGNAASPSGLFRFDTQSNSIVRVAGENDATGSGGFWNAFTQVALTNNNGATLFFGSVKDEVGTVVDAGLYFSDGSTPRKLVGFLDTFQGSTFTALGSNFALNDANQFAFNYILADGQSGIARAQVVIPEASTGILLGFALLGGVASRLRPARLLRNHHGKRGECRGGYSKR